MKSKRLICLMLCALLLTGCAAQDAPLPAAAPTLAPDSTAFAAPIGDAGLMHSTPAAYVLSSPDGQRLLYTYRDTPLDRSQHPAEAIVSQLLKAESTAAARAVGGSVPLSLTGVNPVEVSGGVCTVNLSATALQLSLQDLHSACCMLAETLCSIDGIQSVNILIAGRPVAMDAAGFLPLGALSASHDASLPLLWEQLAAKRTPLGEKPTAMPLTADAALYFPLTGGAGIVPETRRLSFPGQHPQQLVLTLLEALSAGPTALSGVSAMPDLSAMMIAPPSVTDLSTGGKRVTLYFPEDLRSRISALGTDPACTFAGIVYTLTTFVPALEQVCILMGENALTSLHHPAHGSQLFPGGILTRQAFASYLMAQVSVYHAEGEKLHAHTVSLPYGNARSPRALLLRLADAPPECAVLPAGLTDADILGLSIEGDTLLINLSARYADMIRQSAMDQRLMAYAIVNTMCDGLQIRRVRFFFGSQSVETLGGSLIWSGEFLRTPGLIIR